MNNSHEINFNQIINDLLVARKFDEAARLLEGLHQENPENLGVHIGLIDVYMLCKRYDKAEKALSSVQERHPEHLFEFWRSARIAIGLKDIDKAESLIAEASFSPQAKKVYQELADLYDALGHSEKARDVYCRAIELMPDNFEMRRTLFSEWLAEGRLDKALEVSRQALIVTKDSSERLEAACSIRLCQWAETMLAEVAERAQAAQWPHPGRNAIVLAHVVWGAKYIHIFRHHLRSLLAPGNIPKLTRDMDALMMVVTTESDLSLLRQSGILDAFEGIMDFEFVIIPPDLFLGAEKTLPPQIQYHLYAIGLHMGVAFAQEVGAGISMMTADQINADGSFSHVARLIKEGCKGIFGTGMICNQDAFLDGIEDTKGPLVLVPQELTRIAVGNLHQFIERAIVSSSNQDFNLTPAALFWNAEEGLIGHGFNLHPIYVGPEVLAAYQTYCFERVDGLMARRMFKDSALWKDVVVLDDSDQFFFVTLASSSARPSTTGLPFDIDLEKDYVKNKRHVGDFNMWLFRHKLYFKWPEELCRKNEYDPQVVDELLPRVRTY